MEGNAATFALQLKAEESMSSASVLIQNEPSVSKQCVTEIYTRQSKSGVAVRKRMVNDINDGIKAIANQVVFGEACKHPNGPYPVFKFTILSGRQNLFWTGSRNIHALSI